MQSKILWVTLAALLTCTGSALAATIHVPADQPTIQAGINAAVDGDVVLVDPGAYTENIGYAGKSIAVIGSGGADLTTLMPLDPGATVINMGAGGGPGTIFSGFTVIGGTGLNVLRAVALTRPLVSFNIFRDYVGADVIACDGAELTVQNNLFYHNVGVSCVGIYSGIANITNNTFYGNSRGFFSYGVTQARNNIVMNSTDYGAHGSFAVLDYNDFHNNNPDYQGGAAPGPNSISADPLFLNAALNDFQLQANSPCVNTGDPSPLYSDPDGSRSDMGAFPTATNWPFPANINLGPEDPLRVVSHTPSFYWSYRDTGGTQTGFEVEVGTDADWPVAEMWSSGPISSIDTFALYSGSPLVDATTYNTRIRLRNSAIVGDWVAYAFYVNSNPSTPVPLYPIGQHPYGSDSAALYVFNSTDLERDHLIYDFEVYSDSELGSLIAARVGRPETPGETSSGLIFLFTLDAQYWWRSRSFDGYEYSDWCALVKVVNANTIPTAPVPVSPPDGSSILTDQTYLYIQDATDLESPELFYDWELYRDSSLTTLETSVQHVDQGYGQGNGQSRWKVIPQVENAHYWWRVRAWDGMENGPWSNVWSFWQDAINTQPDAFALQSPADGSLAESPRPLFLWQPSFDPDPNTDLIYKLSVALNPAFTFVETVDGLTSTSYEWPDSLPVGITYWWKVQVSDGRGGSFISPVWSFTRATCQCPCHADPQCDGATDVLDIVRTVDRAFRAAAPTSDPGCIPHESSVDGRTDVDCSGSTDILDVVKVVDVAFRGGDPAVKFCSPCGQ